MTDIELKNILHEAIDSCKDLDLLHEVMALFLVDQDENQPIRLTDKDVNSIEISRKQVENGQYREHSEFMAELKVWLGE